jgi:hypothetical protein
MIVPSTRHPNIEHGLKDHTSIALTLLNTILEITSTWDKLELSWEVVEQDISIHEHWEARQR